MSTPETTVEMREWLIRGETIADDQAEYGLTVFVRADDVHEIIRAYLVANGLPVPAPSSVDTPADTPAPRVWRAGDKAVWRGRVVTIAGVHSDGEHVALHDFDSLLLDRDITELSEVPPRHRWHVNQRVEIHNAITGTWSPATLTVVGSVTVPFEAVLDDGPACRFYNASPSHLRPLSEVPAGGGQP